MLTKSSVVNNLAAQSAAGNTGGKTVTINTPAKDGDKKEGAQANSSSGDPQTPAAAKEALSKQPITPAHTKEAYKALGGGIGDAIVDLQVSANESQEQILSRNGYCQVLQEIAFQNNNVRKSTNAATTTATTFSNKTSIWIWRRSQGTCSGRLKPIIDIILYSTGVSSDLVLAGYTCDPVTIAGQYVWIKRATSEEEEKDAIIDLYVTTGRMKDATDPVWQSPGVGWIRIDGNFTKSMFGSVDSFVWYRPARSRSMDMQMTNPVKGAVALTDEVRQTKLIAAVRLGLRHYVPTNDVKRLSNLVLESNETVHSDLIRSERMVDFSSVYHKYDNKGKMNPSKWAKLLHDVGLNMKPNDITQCFNFFDSKHNGIISIEEFTHVLSLTDYEIDLALEKIRLKLLMPCVPKDLQKQFSQNKNSSANAGIGSRTDIGVIGAQSIAQHPYIGKNKIRENMTLSQIFKMVNMKADSILSLDEILDLAAKVEVFLTEEEARKMYAIMDMNGDDRVEEADFIAFMRKESTSIAKKAFRVRESAALLRRWLVRGTSEKVESNVAATASKQQWKEFKARYEKSTGQKFPGFLSARVLQLTMANLGVRLSATEARELALVVAPEKSGRVHLAELHSFMGRNCRSFGELIALIHRELLTDLIDSYCAYRQSVKTTGKEDFDLLNVYKKKVDDIKKTVETIYSKPVKDKQQPERSAADDLNDRDNDMTPLDDDDEEEEARRSQSVMQQPVIVQPNDPQSRFRKSSQEIIAIAQLKLGLQEVFSSKKLPDNMLPNNEEWACLAILVDAAVAEGEVYGVRLKAFLEGLCNYIYSTNVETQTKLNEKIQLEIVSRELKLQIYREAKIFSNSKRLKKPDYQSVFNLFDENKNGLISLSEFKSQLKKLQLVDLSENQFQSLLALFDKSKRGSISFDDFRAFAEEAIDEGLDEQDLLITANANSDLVDSDMLKSHAKKAATSTSTGIVDDDDEDDDGGFDDIGLLLSDNGGAPPVPITRSGDCDWLAWFLYRQAYRVDPVDAESVISELENRCTETEIASNKVFITVKEFWNILGEFDLRGKMTKDQYLAGVNFVCDYGESKANGKSTANNNTADEDRVDYTAMCKYTLRMGRAFLAQVQEKNREMEKHFPTQLAELKKYFKALCEESTKDRNEIPRYEKIFRRLDSDGDGMLTPKEFRKGLKQLQYKEVAKWNIRMVKRLFDECDKNKDGLLSIKEFGLYVLDRSSDDLKRSVVRDSNQDLSLTVSDGNRDRSGLNTSMDKLNLSDDEDDEVFRKRHALTDHELIRKVNDILMDIVPRESNSTNPVSHLEVVRSSVRRFFQRADPEFKGVVSEERFRAFLRRSGLQDNLTASELRRLTDKLKKRGAGKDRYETLIDYEKLCQQLLVVSESIPKSKSEVIFNKFQDAAIQSNAAGRSFLSLCSLVDLRLTGRISKEELIHISKMMDCEMTAFELEAMLEMIPSVLIGNTVSTSSNANSGAKVIDYRALSNILQNYTPRDLDSRMMNNTMRPNMSMTGLLSSHALPAYATPGVTHIPGNALDPMMLNRSINTPLGLSISTPMRQYDSGASSPFPGGGGGGMSYQSSSAYDKILRTLIDRVRLAIDERSRSWNTTFSLRKKLETLDLLNTGLIGVRSFQMALDEVGVTLTTSELQAMMSTYGRPDDDRLFYDSFCRLVEGNGNQNQRDSNNNNNRDRERERDRESSRESKDNFGNTMNRGSNEEPYVNARVIQRLKELKADGRNPMDMFEVYDLDRTGMVTISKFKDVITKLQLLQTEHQLIRAMEDFSSIGNSSYINYEDFCLTLEKVLRNKSNNNDASLRLSMTNTRRSTTGNVMDGDGYDGFRSSRSNVYEDYPSGRDDPREYYDSLHRTANQNAMSRSNNFAIELDAGSDSNYHDYALSPPKPSDSIAFSRSRALSPTRIARSSFDSFANTSSSVNRPRTSPSKVGAKMWGNETPLAQKGHPLRGDEDKWCCAVCLYVENPASSDVCLVCDSPNYNNRKDYQIKEQCRNCTFLNGQFAEECEMCGEPLSHHNNAKKGVMSTPRTNNNNSRNRRDVYY